MNCKHCKKKLSIHFISRERLICWNCLLAHDPESGTPIGWLVEIGGKSGGIIPFEQIHALAGSDTSPEMVATLIRIAAMRGLQDSSVIREALGFETQLARGEVHLN